MLSTNIQHKQERLNPFSERLSSFFAKYWFLVFSIILGLYVGLPFLAPIFMNMGWSSFGKGIYLIYSFLCHQLPERSYFFFGPKISYSLNEIHAAGVDTTNMLLLRKFIGNPAMGWKVAWSDRMVSMFASMFLFGLIWRPLRRSIPKLPWWGLLLFLLPMAVDGTSHAISDLAGIGQGFRDSNAWLAVLTNHAFLPGFYAGDGVGSFNSWMRLLTGILFGLGIVWFGYLYLDDAFLAPVRYRLQKAEYDRQLLERMTNDASHPTL